MNRLKKIGSSATVNYNWVDVKDDFWKASEDLETGELVHDNLFGLFEAMSAIEIMDAKMDAGMVCNRKRKVYQFQEAIQEKKVKIKDLNEHELLGIMDELTACFVTWLDGQSLVQSVFTCMYCHDPLVIEDIVLKALCIAILKMVDIIRNICIRTKVFEEEDFQPSSYGFKLSSDVTELRVSGMLREAEEEISKKIKSFKSSDSENMSDKLNQCSAIKNRLKFWRSFYCALLCFDNQETEEVSKSRDHLQSALGTIEEMGNTLLLGLQADPSKEYYMLGFDPLINQRLLPPSFPKQSELTSRKEATAYLGRLVERLQKACNVLQCTTFHMILDFLCEFSQALPCVLSRSILQLLVIRPNNRIFGKFILTDMIRESIKLFNGTPAVADMSPLTSQEAKLIVNDFLVKAVKPMISLVEAYGHNRARQREKLAVLLEDLGELQAEADRADQELHIMLQVIDSKGMYENVSFISLITDVTPERDLSKVRKLVNRERYLDYLFGWTNNCLHRAESLLTIQEQYVDRKCGKKEKKKKKEILAACQDQVKLHKSLRLFFSGMKDLCLGNLKAYEGFDKDGKIKRPEMLYDSEKIRFEHRFHSFQAINTHQSATYKDYKEMTAPTSTMYQSSTDLYAQSTAYFQRAMEALQLIEQVDSEGEKLMKVAKRNFVVMKLAASGHNGDPHRYPEWDFSVHQSYPMIKIS